MSKLRVRAELESPGLTPWLKSRIWTYSHDSVTDQKGQSMPVWSVSCHGQGSTLHYNVSVSSVAEREGLPIRVSLFGGTYREGLSMPMSQFTDREGLFLSCLRLVIQIRTLHNSVSYYVPNLFLTVLTMFQAGFGIETVHSYLGEGKLFLEQRNPFFTRVSQKLEVMNCITVCADYLLDVIDVFRQQSCQMSLGQFAQCFNNP